MNWKRKIAFAFLSVGLGLMGGALIISFAEIMNWLWEESKLLAMAFMIGVSGVIIVVSWIIISRNAADGA